MKIKNLKNLGLVALFSFAFSTSGVSNAWAGGSINLMGGAIYSMPDGSPKPTEAWGFPGGGLVFGIGLGTRTQIEVGGFYLTRKYTLSEEVTTRLVQGQLGLRFALGRTFLVNLGGYGNYYFSDPSYFTGNDIGVYGGLGIRFPLGSKVSLLINPQYHYAINTLTYSAGTISPHEVLLTAGFTFGTRSSK